MKNQKIIKNSIAVPSPINDRIATKNIVVTPTAIEGGRQLPRSPKLNFDLNPRQAPVPQYSLSKEISPEFNSSDTTAFDATTNTASFDALTKIASDKPEIIALSEFLPCYTEKGELNKTGEFLQVKQDALLISCVDSLNNILEFISKEETSDKTSKLKQYINDSSNELYNFCNTFSSNVNWFLGSVENVKKSFNFKNFILAPEEQKLRSTVQEDYLNNFPSLKEILPINENDFSNWTLTKLWLQLCTEYKESLVSGTGFDDSLFIINGHEVSNENFDNPYSIHRPKNFGNKLTFNNAQVQLPNIFAEGYDPTTAQNFKILKNTLNNIFTNQKYSIFNVSMRDLVGVDTRQKAKNIAQLNHLICRELNYSMQLRKLKYSNSNIFSAFGYPLNLVEQTNNLNFLNVVIGNTGNDITEIINPGASSNKSLVGVAQKTISENNSKYEILSFENRYINDDKPSVNQKARNAILTPGSVYYVENILNLSQGVDTNRLKNLQSEIETTVNALTDLNNQITGFMFSNTAVPRTIENINGNSNAYNSDSSSVNRIIDAGDFKELIKNPIYLIRYLEKQLLDSKTGNLTLLQRGVPQSQLTMDTSIDISLVLISLGISQLFQTKNDNLLTLLFMYVVAKMQNLQSSQLNIVVSNIKDHLIQLSLSTSANNDDTAKIKRINIASIDASNVGMFHNLDKIATMFAAIISNIKEVDPVNPRVNFNPNPFGLVSSANDGTTIQKTYFSGIAKESIMLGLFYICCLILHENNPEAIVQVEKVSPGSAKAAPSSIVVKKIKTLETITKIKTVETIFGGVTNEIEHDLLVYEYDNIVVESEKMIYDEILRIKKMTSWFITYLSSLKYKINSFIGDVHDNPNVNFYDDIYDRIIERVNDKNLVNAALTIEQLKLLQNKLAYIRTRFQTDYSSAIKTLVPYFVNLKNDPIVDKILPIEDLHLVAWKFFLKDYLKSGELLEGVADNKKILSVGIPHKLYQKLQRPVDVTSLNNSISSFNLVYINVYMIDNLRPLLVHKPQKFIFDLNKFPSRILNYYIDTAVATQKKLNNEFAYEDLDVQNFDYINYLPFFNLQDFQNISDIRADFAAELFENNDYLNYIGLDKNQTSELKNNHIRSFFMEEYLRFLSGCGFDEQSFFNYGTDIEKIKSVNITAPVNTLGAINYLKNTLLIGSNNVKKMLISPKKFDRVFHIIVDPDDFEINMGDTNSKLASIGLDQVTALDLVQRYNSAIEIIETKDALNNTVMKYKRKTSKTKDVEFNEFYVDMEIIS